MGYGSKLPEGTVLVNPVDVHCVGVIDGKGSRRCDESLVHAFACGQVTACVPSPAYRDQIERLDFPFHTNTRPSQKPLGVFA